MQQRKHKIHDFDIDIEIALRKKNKTLIASVMPYYYYYFNISRTERAISFFRNLKKTLFLIIFTRSQDVPRLPSFAL